MVLHRLQTAGFTLPAVIASSLVGAALLPGACTKMPLVAPSGTVITLIATTNVLPVNGSTDIIAILVEQGQQATPTTGTGTGTTPGGTTTTTSTTGGTPVHNGTVVSFTTTLGRMEPAEAKTTGGQVTVKLVADGRSGVATVTAYSGGATKQMTINVGSAAAARLLVTASPQTLPAAGGTATVTATVQDQQGNPISGVPVAFSTTAGTLGVTSAVTDSFGNATTTLTASANAKVTASTGGGTTGTLSGTVDLSVLPNATVSITGPTGTVTVSTTTSLTVGVGAAVPATEVVLDFGDGDSTSLGAISQNTTVAHMYGRAGTYTASVTAKFVDGQTKTARTDVVVNDFTVAASCGPDITISPTSNATSTLVATVTPSSVSISDYVWEFGEGSPQHGSPTTHTWHSRGTKVVLLTVVPTKGSSKQASCTLEVK